MADDACLVISTISALQPTNPGNRHPEPSTFQPSEQAIIATIEETFEENHQGAVEPEVSVAILRR